MGFVIWYRLEFRTALDGPALLQVSNDALQGDLLLDADVETRANLGPHPSTFRIRLVDLPLEAARGLAEQSRSRAGSDAPLLVRIQLGYFDQPASQQASVLLGAVTEIHNEVTANGSLQTLLTGTEHAGFLLRQKAFHYHKLGESTFKDVIEKIKESVTVPIKHPEIAYAKKDLTIDAGTALGALGELATRAKLPLAIRAGIATLGIADDSASPVRFRADTNIVSKRRRDSAAPDPQGGSGTTTRYEMTVLGDPALQIGAKVELEGNESRTLRIESVHHSFSLHSGYTCDVTVFDTSGPIPAEALTGAPAVADGMHAMTRALLEDHPSIDVGEVASYNKSGAGDNGGHRATMQYGQRREASSVDDPVGSDLQLHDKPMASIFAWDKTGLMVPVYPGMRALLLHNTGQVNDAVAGGFLWSRHANHEPPPNEAGDYWLCLPTKVSDGRPAGKTVNDLTDATGHRVIQAMGLDIQVGTGVLPEVGVRPTPTGDQSLTIKHGKGTTITISEDGSVGVTTAGKDIKLDNGKASIVLGEGEITLNADKIKLSAKSVDVG
ncbi:hypothetical protein [Nocardia sp. NPDC049149]|uniref:hypothetical protein n=1 Tax=Nocardia sp. NPDC049149 TaxID=3364315 RepID=UPI00371A656E